MKISKAQRNIKESLAIFPLAAIFLILAYFAPEFDSLFFSSFFAGLTLFGKAVYPFVFPLAAKTEDKLVVYCRPFKKIEMDLDSVTSVCTSGPGIFPKYFHFDFGKSRISFNPNFSIIQNDGMVLKRFLENQGIRVTHVSETN